MVPYPMDSITQQGGIFEGPIYAQYSIPNSPAAFVTVQWVEDNLVAYLTQNQFTRAGNGVSIDANGEILAIDSGLVA